MNCYEVIAGRPVSAQIKSLVDTVQSGVDTIVSKKGLINYKESIDTVQPIDCLRYFAECNLVDSSNQALTNIFLAHLSSTESNSAGSGIIFSTALCVYLKKGLRIQQLSNKREDAEVDVFTGKRCTIDEAKQVLYSFCDANTSDMVLEAVRSIGSEGSLVIEAHTSHHPTTLTIDNMFRFDASVSEVFMQQTGRSGFELTNPKVVTIDGFIESTSEIDSLMRQSFESGQPLIIAARGYHGDVSNTLAHNYVNGKLRVVPLEVRYDELGANSLIDMSKVVGSKFINSLRGDLISTTDLEEDAGSVEYCSIKKEQVGFKAPNSRSIERQRLKLIKKMQNSSHDVKKIIDARIKSLTPSCCTVSIKTQKGMKGLEKDRATSAVRIFRDVCSSGYVDLTSINVHDSYFMSTLFEQLIESGITHVPTKSLNRAIKSAVICAETFLGLGACLVIDEEQDSCL